MIRRLFYHIGQRIKDYAKVIFWLLFISMLLVGVALGMMTLYSARNANAAVVGTVLVILAPVWFFISLFICWLVVSLLYGYGELIEQTQQINDRLARLEQEITYRHDATEDLRATLHHISKVVDRQMQSPWEQQEAWTSGEPEDQKKLFEDPR